MSRLLVIGCGGVAQVAISKICQDSETFTEIMIASRTKSKCDDLKAKLEGKTSTKIETAALDADKVEEVIACLLYTSDLLKGDVVGNDNIEYIRARNIKISSDSELESDVDGDKSDNLPVEIKVLAQRVEVFSKPKED